MIRLDYQRGVAYCSDGTTFDLHDELVRGEPRFYWPMMRPAGSGARARRIDGVNGSYRRSTAWAELKRLAQAYEDSLPTEGA